MAYKLIISRSASSAKLFIVFFIYALTQSPSAASDTIETSGDYLQILIPAVALSTELVSSNQEEFEFYRSFTANLLVTHALKLSISKERPNGSDNNSFPSGHTSAAFQGAAFIHKRHGINYAIPAYIGATFVGYSRIEADKHDLKDVLAGATIGFISSYYSDGIPGGFEISPAVNQESIGIKLNKNW